MEDRGRKGSNEETSRNWPHKKEPGLPQMRRPGLVLGCAPNALLGPEDEKSFQAQVGRRTLSVDAALMPLSGGGIGCVRYFITLYLGLFYHSILRPDTQHA